MIYYENACLKRLLRELGDRAGVELTLFLAIAEGARGRSARPAED